MKYTVEQVYRQIGKVTHEHQRLAKMAEDLILDNLQLKQASRWIPVDSVKPDGGMKFPCEIKTDENGFRTHWRPTPPEGE